MKSSIAIPIALLGLCQNALADPLTWPTPDIDELEDIRFLQSGYVRRGFIDFVAPCSFSAAGNGRITAAEWIRAAYHDMSTADVVAGTGGLDASIQFETDRSENIGAAMNATLVSMLGYYTHRSSMSDLLALGVFTATANCGGPSIPYRVGRIDAEEAGPVGVPEPTDNITIITDKFARQGFNTSDMIALVACGHTLGGVHGEDFPTVVTGNGTAGHKFSHFDSTTKFDNLIATEYLSGNTTNPLVVGPDPEKNSDLVVFSADGNQTMERLADPDTFQNTCRSLLERMIDTVPNTVTLSEPLEPYPVKPAMMKLGLSDDGSNLTFSGAIRVRTTERAATNISSVTLNYLAKDGVSTGAIKTTQASFLGGTTVGFGEVFQWYEFTTTLNASSSISSFNVSIALTNGTVEEHTNNGVGFPVQSNIFYQESRSCSVTNATGGTVDIIAAVHESQKDAPVQVTSHIRVARQGSVVPALDSFNTSMTLVNSTGSYSFYKASFSLTGIVSDTYIDLVSGEGADSEADLFHTLSSLGEC